MPDLRTVLTETLREHQETSPHISSPSCSCGWINRQYGINDSSEHWHHVADVLLGLPGVAVTQLPDAETEYIDVQVGSKFYADCDCGWTLETADHIQLESAVQHHTDRTGHIWPSGPIEDR